MRWQLASQGGQEMPEMLLVDNERLLRQNASHASHLHRRAHPNPPKNRGRLRRKNFRKPSLSSLLLWSVTWWHRFRRVRHHDRPRPAFSSAQCANVHISSAQCQCTSWCVKGTTNIRDPKPELQASKVGLVIIMVMIMMTMIMMMMTIGTRMDELKKFS